MQIIPTPTAETAKCGEFVLPEKIYLKTRKISNKSFIRLAKELTQTFFGGTSVLEVIETPSVPDKVAVIDAANSAEAAKLPSELSLGENEYVLDIEADGVTILFRDEKALIHAFMSFLMGFEMKTKGRYTAPCRLIEDRPSISFRGVHLCVFPETTLDFLKKCVRVCGMLKYTHIVIEFWGTYRYACTDLLSWDSAYTKEELLPIIDDIRGFGAEPVPMLNFLGHASQSRVMGGKHVTLDRHPEAEYLFENDGWTWRVDENETLELIESAARELCELFGEGEYFHFGCDEVYSIMQRDDQAEFLERHLGRIERFSEKLGRRPLIWGDMLIDFERAFADRGANKETLDGTPGLETYKALAKLSKRHVLCDWQYFIRTGRAVTAEQFTEKGFDTLLCPWTRGDNMRLLCREAVRLNCMGILMTTWHTIMENFGALAECADYMWSPDAESRHSAYQTVCATLVRKLVPSKDYASSGWQANQLTFNR